MEMETREAEVPEAPSTLSIDSIGRVLILLAVAVGVLLFILGTATENVQEIYAGLIIAPVALFSGGFLLKAESGAVRLGMLLAGGLILMYTAASAFGYAVNLGMY